MTEDFFDLPDLNIELPETLFDFDVSDFEIELPAFDFSFEPDAETGASSLIN